MEHGASTGTWVLIFNVISFLTVMLVLGKFGWPAILNALKQREEQIKRDLEAADQARRRVEELKSQLDHQIAGLDTKAKELLNEARQKADESAARIIKSAESQAKDILVKSQKQMDQERERLLRELRSHVGSLTILAAERIMEKNVDRNVHAKMVDELLNELDRSSSREAQP